MNSNFKNIYRKTDSLLGIILMNRYFFKRNFLDILEEELTDCRRILEIGSGRHSYLRDLRNKFELTAIDISYNQLSSSRKLMVYDKYVQGDVKNIQNLVRAGYYDAVVAMDLIEHLEKEEGKKLLEDLSFIAGKKIIIYTPNGFVYQPPAPDNIFQEHKSGWSYDEMRLLGFKVKGINGFKKLTGLYAIPKIKPESAGIFLRDISSYYLRLVKKEEWSYSILCIKDTRKSLSA
jgi:hypothetical protein